MNAASTTTARIKATMMIHVNFPLVRRWPFSDAAAIFSLNI
jgi:hypothetical protein